MAKKKVTKVYLTYRGGTTSPDNTGVVPRFAVDGGSFTGAFNNSAGAEYVELPGEQTWTTIELFPRDNASGIRSFAFGLEAISDSDPTQSNFHVNDITIVYRIKDVKWIKANKTGSSIKA